MSIFIYTKFNGPIPINRIGFFEYRMNNNINELNKYISTNEEIENEDVKPKKYVNTLIPSGNASYLSINNKLSDNLKLFTSPILSILPNDLLVNLSSYLNPEDDNNNKLGEERTKNYINKLENNYNKKGLKKIRKQKKSDYFSVANLSKVVGGYVNDMMDFLEIPDVKLEKPAYITDGVNKIDEEYDCKKLRNREVEIVLTPRKKSRKPKPVNKNSKEYKDNIKTLNKLEKEVKTNINETEKEFKKQQEKKLAEYFKINKEILKEAKIEAKSFMVDKKLNDSKAIINRLNGLLSF